MKKESNTHTGRKRMYEEISNARHLADSALRFAESVLSAVPTPVFYKDREGRYLGVNNAFAELMGYTPDYYKGKTVMELWPDEFASVYHEKDLELMRNPEKQIYEFKVVDKDGIVHSTIWGKNVFRDENGQVAGIVGAFVDITGLKQAEDALCKAQEELELRVSERTRELKQINKKLEHEIAEHYQTDKALQEKEEQLRTLINAMPDMVVFKDGRGRYLEANDFNLHFFGLDGTDYRGKTDKELAEYIPFYRESLNACMESDELAWQAHAMNRIDEIIPRPDGSTRVFDTIKLPTYYTDGQRKGLLVVGRDITERKQAEEALREAHTDLERRVEERTTELREANKRLTKEIEERKRVEEVLRLAEEEKTLLLNSTLDLVVYHDLDMRIIWANNVAATSVNMTQEELKGRYCWEIWHGRNTPCIGCPVIMARDTGEVNSAEISSPDGRKWYIRGYPIKSDTGKVIALTEFCLDITDRKQSEVLQNAVYRISQAASKATNLDELYKSVHEIIETVMSAKNFYISLYDEKKDLISYPYFVDELDEAPHENATPGKGLTEYVLRTGKPLFCDEATDIELHQKGEVDIVGSPSAIWIGVPLTIESKTIGVMVVQHYTNPNAYSNRELQMLEFVSSQVAKAIEYKRTEVKLRTLSLAIEQSPASIMITDTAANIEYVNPAFVQLTGYTLEEVFGKNPRILKSGEKKPEEYRVLWETITSGKEWRGEFYNKKKNGVLFWEWASISPIFDSSGNMTHFLGVKEDITMRKKYETELIQAREKAEESDNLKTAFLRNLSHEIRTPMNAIMGFSNLLNVREIDSDEQQVNIRIIQESSQQLLSIINDIVDISSIEANILSKNISSFNINATLSSLYEQFQLEAQKKSIALILNPGMVNDQAIIQTDNTKLVQILSNLLNNAFKFTNTGSVEFGYNQKGTAIEFYVSDTGIGIPPEQHSKIFQNFYQIESSISRQYEGMGLGLAICKAYTELLGGKIGLISEIGKGTTFYLTIPYCNPESDQISQPASYKPADITITGYLTILVADDDDLNFKLLERILSSSDIKLLRAVNGKEAVGMCMLHKAIDLVLMDIRMPEMDGYSATSIIRESYPYLPIIALSAYATDKEEALKSGCSDFISKPFKKEYLINMIQKYILDRSDH